MTRLTARSSTIFIAIGDKTQVYRSVAEVPAGLRRKLAESTRGMNSATILIADKRGREELVRALQGQPSDVQCRLVDTIKARENVQRHAPQMRRPLRAFITWLELFLPLAAGASLWLLIGAHF